MSDHDRLTSDMSFWLKFVRDSNLSVNNSTILKYSMALADRFSSIEEFSKHDDNDLLNIGIVNRADRTRLLEQARLLNEKTNQQFPLKKRSEVVNRVIESWIGDSNATPLSSNSFSKSTTNLSPALLSRISFNNRPVSVAYPYDEPINHVRKRNFGHLTDKEEKVLIVDDNGKIRTTNESALEYQGILKSSPSVSIHGMRTIKSLSDTISIQKKIPVGTDRLKRLDSSTSLFQRQTSLLTRKVSNIANKLVNPFSIIKKKIEPSTTTTTTTTTTNDQVDLRTTMKRQISIVPIDNNGKEIIPSRSVTISPLKRARDDEEIHDYPQERRKVQILSVNNEIRRPTGLFSYEEKEEKPNVLPIQTLGSKRFKLGATTSFLTRSLANHGLIE